MENLLSKFLNVGLLPHLENNERFGFVESATEEVSKKLAKNRVNLIRFTLAALNPNVSAEEHPAIRETDEILRKYWKTISVNVPDAPRQIWRAIIWEALNRQAKDDFSATVVWLTAASLFEHTALDAAERQLLSDFLLSLGGKAERRAGADWQKTQAPKDSPATETPAANFDNVKVGTVITEKFQEDLMKACGPNDVEGNALKEANRYWANNNASWSADFAKIASQAIGKRIDGSSAALAGAIKSELQKFSAEIEQSIAQSNRSAESLKDGERLRDELLWWRQTLCSPLLKISYRALEPASAVLLMAFDLHRLLSLLHPVSVEFLLREVFRAAQGDFISEKIELAAAIEKMSASGQIGKAVESATANYYKNFESSLPLFGIVKNSLQTGKVSEESLLTIGLNPKTEIAYEELAVWLFRDLQAYRLAALKESR